MGYYLFSVSDDMNLRNYWQIRIWQINQSTASGFAAGKTYKIHTCEYQQSGHDLYRCYYILAKDQGNNGCYNRLGINVNTHCDWLYILQAIHV